MKSIGFKEWSLVCDALGRGDQSIIFRKGGIAEGRSGFSFRHHEFFLFPTFFHEQIGKVRNATGELRQPDGAIAVNFFATVERAMKISSLEMAEALRPLHALSDEVLRERFDYKGKGLNVAFVRIYRIEPAWHLANEKRYGGCRSWVDLPEPPAMNLQPVLTDAIYLERRSQFDLAISSSAAPG
jgi:hypothetical protein